jgi:hypothetical protein
MVIHGLASVVIAFLTVDVSAQPPLATGADAEVSEDGLHRINRSVMDDAWVRPGLNLSQYDKVYFLPTGVSFREIEGREVKAGSRFEQLEYRVNDEKQREFRQQFRNTFFEDIADVNRFELTTTPGRDVLIAQGFLVDVVSHVPPDTAGRLSSSLRTTWEATMVLELRDSMSHDMLARTVERERPQGAVSSNDLWRDTRILLGRWSQILCTRLEELAEIGVP